VIFDLSGTVLDFGSRGPVIAFVELFRRHGVPVSEAVARGPMGMLKRDHIWTILTDPEVGQRWASVHGSLPTVETLDKLYAEFTPLQVEVLKNHCDILPGVPELVQSITARGIKYASTTGFETNMMGGLIPLANAAGFKPEIFMCPDMVGGGRPAPWMAFHAAKTMGVYPMKTIVKIGDTPVDVAEAHAAGMWAVSVVRHGNSVGISEAELNALSPAEREAKFSAARAKLAVAGPHYIIDATADLLPVLDDITARLARGERP
jgi:phosphonoacetaldehyde hydrolase